jgi:hypothetical protein
LTDGSVSFGCMVVSARDLNADGFDDVFVGTGGSLFLGGPGSTFDATVDFVLPAAGRAARAVGDVDGDGWDDFAAATGATEVNIFLGGPTFDAVPDFTLTVAAPMQFGFTLTGDDLNGDALADVVVGDRLSFVGGVSVGQAYVFLAGPATFDALADGVLPGSTAYEDFSYAVAAVGDLNGDGIGDIAIGGAGNRVAIYAGGPGAVFDPSADLELFGGPLDAYFGTSIAAAR